MKIGGLKGDADESRVVKHDDGSKDRSILIDWRDVVVQRGNYNINKAMEDSFFAQYICFGSLLICRPRRNEQSESACVYFLPT
jgi:hypothetical protein